MPLKSLVTKAIAVYEKYPSKNPQRLGVLKKLEELSDEKTLVDEIDRLTKKPTPAELTKSTITLNFIKVLQQVTNSVSDQKKNLEETRKEINRLSKEGVSALSSLFPFAGEDPAVTEYKQFIGQSLDALIAIPLERALAEKERAFAAEKAQLATQLREAKATGERLKQEHDNLAKELKQTQVPPEKKKIVAACALATVTFAAKTEEVESFDKEAKNEHVQAVKSKLTTVLSRILQASTQAEIDKLVSDCDSLKENIKALEDQERMIRVAGHRFFNKNEAISTPPVNEKLPAFVSAANDILTKLKQAKAGELMLNISAHIWDDYMFHAQDIQRNHVPMSPRSQENYHNLMYRQFS